MNYVDPFREDASVTDNDIVYPMGYYRHPETLAGVTDETHAVYDPATTYSVGEYCTVPELFGIYRSSDDGNIGNFPSAVPTKWTFWSPINSYCMLAVDEFIGSQTTGTDIVMEFNFSKATAFAIVDCDFTSVIFTLTDNNSGEVVWTGSSDGSGYGATSYYEYFYGELSATTRIYKGGLPWLSNATLKIEFTGDVAIGAIVMGKVGEMGCTLTGTSLRFEDTSTIQKSEVTGFRTVTRYGSVRILDVGVIFDTEDFNVMANTIDSIIGHNILFVPLEDDNFSEMITIGYFENFEIPLDGMTKIKTQTTIIGAM